MSFTVRPILDAEYAQAREVWDACFPEDAYGYSAYYFARRTAPANVLAAFDGDGAMVGALHAVPYPLRFGDGVKPCAMVAGVATLPAFRHRGVAAALIHAAHARLKENGVCAAVLKPDVDFYAQFGYLPFAWHGCFTVSAGGLDIPVPALHGPDAREMLVCYGDFARQYNGMMARTEGDMALMLEEAFVLGAAAYAAQGAYAIGAPNGDGCFEVSELVGRDSLPLIAALAEKFGKVRFRLPWGAAPDRLPAGERMMFSMLCPLDEAALLEGTGARTIAELLSGEIKPNCTLEFC